MEDEAELDPEEIVNEDDEDDNYGLEEDSEDQNFIAPEEDIEKEELEARKQEKLEGGKKSKQNRRRKKDKGEDSGVDDEDLELINENLAAKGNAGASKHRKLRQVHDLESSSDGGIRKPSARNMDSDNDAPVSRMQPPKPRTIKAPDEVE